MVFGALVRVLRGQVRQCIRRKSTVVRWSDDDDQYLREHLCVHPGDAQAVVERLSNLARKGGGGG